MSYSATDFSEPSPPETRIWDLPSWSPAISDFGLESRLPALPQDLSDYNAWRQPRVSSGPYTPPVWGDKNEHLTYYHYDWFLKNGPVKCFFVQTHYNTGKKLDIICFGDRNLCSLYHFFEKHAKNPKTYTVNPFRVRHVQTPDGKPLKEINVTLLWPGYLPYTVKLNLHGLGYDELYYLLSREARAWFDERMMYPGLPKETVLEGWEQWDLAVPNPPCGLQLERVYVKQIRRRAFEAKDYFDHREWILDLAVSIETAVKYEGFEDH